MMRVAVIGMGSAGRRHADHLGALGCIVDRYDAQPGDGIAHAADWRPSSADAVVVATPWDAHLAYTEQAIRAGCPVLVEKPLGTLDELPRWRALVADAQSVVTQVGYQCRFHPAWQTMRAQGDPVAGYFVCRVDMRTWPGRRYGPVWLEASHDLDLALSCGADLDLSMGRCRRSRNGRWSVWVQDQSPYYRSWRLQYASGYMEAVFQDPAALGAEMYRAQLVHFCACAQTGRQTDVPLADGLRVLEVVAEVAALP